MTKTLVTGSAGFVGMHLAEALLNRGDQVIGVDSLNDYYDVSLKEARLARLTSREGFSFEHVDLADRGAAEALFEQHDFSHVAHMAAQPGVRYSLENPHAYTRNNIEAQLNILEGCRHHPVQHLVYASSSSVYGANRKTPFSTRDPVDHPISLYAATKKSAELITHAYAHLYRIPCTGLRFFTVYGPWGRPDMAPYKFTRAILAGETIDVFNNGDMRRDFTYIDDIIEGVVRLLDTPAEPDSDWDERSPDPSRSNAPFRVFNIGNNQPVQLMDFIAALEQATGRKAKLNMQPMQPGDVYETYADVDDLQATVSFRPDTPILEGLKRFVGWYRDYYGVS